MVTTAPGLRVSLLEDTTAANTLRPVNTAVNPDSIKPGMLATLHYNSTIIMHPDTRASFARKLENNLKEGRCRFGIDCLSCRNFIQYELDLQTIRGKPGKIKPGDCQLYKHSDYKEYCTGYLKQRECGQQAKTFGIDFKTYNQIADRTAFMYHHRRNRLIFVALTLPPLKKQINGNELNEAFSRFIENCRTNYNLRHYLAVREGNGLDTRFHYHVILDIRYTSFIKLNSAWVHSLGDFCHSSRNAFRTKKKSYFIRDVAGAVSYISKYVSKTIGQRSDSRVFFCDRETAQAFVKQRFDNDIDELRGDFKSMEKRILNDFVCRITFKSKRDQNIFFHTVVKILFDANWTTPGMTIFIDKPPG